MVDRHKDGQIPQSVQGRRVRDPRRRFSDAGDRPGAPRNNAQRPSEEAPERRPRPASHGAVAVLERRGCVRLDDDCAAFCFHGFVFERLTDMQRTVRDRKSFSVKVIFQTLLRLLHYPDLTLMEVEYMYIYDS